MSTEVTTQTGPSQETGKRQEPREVIRESAKYRRRAQEAEHRSESLEAELGQVRREQDGLAERLQAELVAARSEAESLRGRVEAVERDRRLEQAFLAAGCVDVEAALALAHRRLANGEPPDDSQAFARNLLAEKPHLRGEPASSQAAAPGLPSRTAGVKPSDAGAQRRTIDRLADQARRTGNSKDVMTYMRARRGTHS